MRLVLIVLLVLLLLGALPAWPYMTPLGFGYYPSGIVGLLLLIVIVMALLGPRGTSEI
jgi:hypothetical protein